MRLSEGVEWAAHAAGMLAAVPRGRVMPGAKLAEFLDVPPAYLAKQMQALSRAGIVETEKGPAGGYRLARAPREITLADILYAVEGKEPAFRCQDIRLRGPVSVSKEACKRQCGIAKAFLEAERAFRASLASVTLVEILKDAAQSYDARNTKTMMSWFEDAIR